MTDFDRPPIVVMGVSGCGKSTVGLAIAKSIGAEFVDADDLHPEANKAKMASGHPLDDADREPWLRLVAAALGLVGPDGTSDVVACSALKRAYRDILREQAPSAFFVHLAGPREVIEERVSHRTHEFMPADLVDSQYATLEPLGSDESGVTVDLTLSPDRIVRLVDDAIRSLEESRRSSGGGSAAS